MSGGPSFAEAKGGVTTIEIEVFVRNPISAVAVASLVALVTYSSRTTVGQIASNRSTVTNEAVAALQSAGTGGAGYDEARRVLEAMPPSEAIPAVIEALKVEGVRMSWQARKLAYVTIVFHEGGDTAVGREQLFAGLNDPASEIQRICCKALGPTTMTEEVSRVIDKLVNDDISVREKQTLLGKLRGWGSYASGALDVVGSIFSDRNESEQTRWFSAWAMLEIGGPAGADKLFLMLDPTSDPIGEKVVMWSVSRHLLESMSKHPTKSVDTEYRRKARVLVATAMRSSNKESRQAGFEALAAVYGRGFLVKSDAGEYEAHPGFVEAITHMATHDPDDNLRARAQSVIDTLDQRVRNAARRMQRRQATGGSK